MDYGLWIMSELWIMSLELFSLFFIFISYTCGPKVVVRLLVLVLVLVLNYRELFFFLDDGEEGMV